MKQIYSILSTVLMLIFFADSDNVQQQNEGTDWHPDLTTAWTPVGNFKALITNGKPLTESEPRSV